MSLPPAFQNKNVQIGIIAVGILVAIGFLMKSILGGDSGPPDSSAYGGTGAMMPGGGPPGGPGMMPGGYAPPGMPGSPGYGGYGTDTGGGTAVTTAAAPLKKAGPKPPTRKDPFKSPDELVPPPVPISEALPATPPLYVEERVREISTPTADQFVRDTPDPPMRMAGALWGNRVYGVLEINGSTQVVNPGDKVGIYRVERVERDRIVMSRPGRKGRRQVEAQLSGNPALANQYPAGDQGVPGGPGGYPGPGGPPGGGATGGRTGG